MFNVSGLFDPRLCACVTVEVGITRSSSVKCCEGFNPSMGVSSIEVFNLNPEGVDTEPDADADDDRRRYACCLLAVCPACSSRALSAADVLAGFVPEAELKPGVTPACFDLEVERDDGLSQNVAGNVP